MACSASTAPLSTPFLVSVALLASVLSTLRPFPHRSLAKAALSDLTKALASASSIRTFLHVANFMMLVILNFSYHKFKIASVFAIILIKNCFSKNDRLDGEQDEQRVEPGDLAGGAPAPSPRDMSDKSGQ